MKQYKIERTCIKTRKKNEKENFWRFVLIDDKIVFDEEQKMGRRGFYISKDKNLLNKIKIKKKNYEIPKEVKKILESE